jgi:hypothetical protein
VEATHLGCPQGSMKVNQLACVGMGAASPDNPNRQRRDGMRGSSWAATQPRLSSQVDHSGSVTKSMVLGRKGGSTGLLGTVLCLATASRAREPDARHEDD